MTEWIFVFWLVVDVNGRELTPRVTVALPTQSDCVVVREKALTFFVDVGPCLVGQSPEGGLMPWMEKGTLRWSPMLRETGMEDREDGPELPWQREKGR